MNLVVAKGVLGSYGIQVDTCLSGKEAIELCKRVSYDIVFLDHMMPGFDGVETLRRIREICGGIYQDLAVIALTANTISGAREMFRSEGFTEFVPKPIERTVLERVLRRVLPKDRIHYSTGHVLEEAPSQKPAEAAPPPAEPEEAPAEPSEEAQAAAPGLPLDRLAQAGLDVETGLRYCAGEEGFYREMLRMFSAQSGEKREELDALFESGVWADYAVKAHALKSTSLTIGAQALSAQAKELEMAGKRGDGGYIQAHHSALMAAYEALCEQLTGL